MVQAQTDVVRQTPEAGDRLEWRLLRHGVLLGLAMGGVALFVALAGLLHVFAKREVVGGFLSLSTTVLIMLAFASGYIAVERARRESAPARAHPLLLLFTGGIAGALVGLFLALLVFLLGRFSLREVLVNATPELVDLLTLGLPLGAGMLVLFLGGAGLGLLAVALDYIKARERRAIAIGVGALILVALLRELVQDLLRNLRLDFLRNFLFGSSGLSLWGVLILLLLAGGWVYYSPWLRRFWAGRVVRGRRQQRIGRIALWGVGLVVLLLLPQVLGLYWSDVLDLIGIYVLLGLGLNIVVGYAGLLDLGYVAFFAIGAYVTGYLTSSFAQEFSVRGVLEWPFFAAWPLAIAAAALAGILLGIPVLRMRGDYLAIVTLGFGEIIRIMATSDLLKPYIGGAQGILEIPKPNLLGWVLKDAQSLYYLIFLGVLLAIYVSVRLAPSRVGRAWMAMREDEDVAEAMGINLVAYKLLAFATGAAFAGMSGAIFASKLASIFPHSFNLLWSINVLCLIIVGGMGSIPGVIIGAAVLVGLPEVLREFSEYRMLFYGALLVIMMLVKPEGFWPARRQAWLPTAGTAGSSSDEE
ncbi:MAG: hypothetical protein JXA37_11190 [Chloroflexia bacterium]|nr:hypothetical protein [Chloroflexia bacterium]